MSQSAYGTTTAITAGVMTSTNTVYGLWTNILNKKFVSFECVWTGTPTGTFGYQVTNTPRDPASAVPGSTAAFPVSLNPAGAAGRCLLDIVQPCAGWIRPFYTNVSGAGVLTTTTVVKE